MTDLHHVLPNFSTHSFTHLLPSLEKAQITISDLVTLEAIDIARRALVPVAELQRLANDILQALHSDIVRLDEDAVPKEDKTVVGSTLLATSIRQEQESWQTARTLDEALDAALGGGIPKGYVVEFTGESGAGKTQFLLSLLLNAQLPAPLGFAQSTLYISTEAPLQTARLSQMLNSHPHLSDLPANEKPSLSRVLSIQTPDLESQEHILQYQVPVAIRRQNVGLVVIDSIAANYRAEFEKTGNKHGSMAQRSTKLLRLGNLLRQVARETNTAIVVANQVADRFSPTTTDLASTTTHPETHTPIRPSQDRNGATPHSTQQTAGLADMEPLALDHQQRWFTGWGDELAQGQNPKTYKTPSLGLVWTNQIAARIALVKEPVYAYKRDDGGHMEKEITGWKRHMKVVFAPWAPPSTTVSGPSSAGVPFEIVEAGVRGMPQQPLEAA
ncbi:MAG: hypothetical protein M1821_002701 [Bathelium mastoideum]|nr:MAG: hypothetical protein M1821_002701 [Bathelium mastoideum]